MSTTSANPDRLTGFVDGVPGARAGLGDERQSISADLAGVIGRCDAPVDVPAVASLAALLDTMSGNEVFVSAIRDELMAADVGEAGVATISNATVASSLTAAGVGSPPPVIEVAPVTLVGIPPTSGYVDDPICAANGNMIHQEHDLAFPAIAGALNLVRTYNSLIADRVGVFGAGWSSVLDMRVDLTESGAVSVTLGDGAAVPFVSSDRSWVSTSRREVELTRGDDGHWTLHPDRVRAFEFAADGALTGWRVGVARVDVARDGAGRIVALHERVTGRSVGIEWAGALVTTLTTGDGRRVRFERDPQERIVRAQSDAGWVNYEWDGNLLTSVTDPDGVRWFANEYDDMGRVVRQTSRFGRVTDYRYDPTGMTVITGDDDVRQAMIHDRRGNLTAVIDVDGGAMRFRYDDRDRVIEVVERDGATWAYEYDGRGDLIRRIDPDGLSQQWVWDDAHRIVTEIDRAGSATRMEFDTELQSPNRVITADGAQVSQVLDGRGLPLEVTDADGVVTRFEWDADGQLVATTDAFGNSTTFEYDARGLLRQLTQPAGDTTLLDRDRAGRVVRAVKGDAVATYEHTAAGRVSAGSEPGDLAWSAAFGSHGAMTAITDATGATAQFEHDALGNVTAVIAPDGARYTSTFSPVGLHLTVSDPTGATATKGYDRRGRLDAFTDAEGSTWRREFDALGRTVASTDPTGGVTRWTYHPGGEVASVTAPDGRTWTTEIDALGRPIAVTDPMGGWASIEYTPGGRIARRTSPAGRVESFEYDAAGRLSVVVGVDGVRRFFDHDGRGFVTAVTDGRERRAFEWDDDYRLIGMSSDAGATRVARDAGGRVIEAVDPTGAAARFGYDRRGLIDEAVDPAGLATNYGYDERGRLARQTAPGEREMRFEYGLDGRLSGIVDPTGAVTSYLRDANGALTGMRHGDGGGWDRELDPLGRETRRTATDRSVLGRYEYDAANRLRSATVPGTDVFTRFLWDDNDRLVATGTVGGGTFDGGTTIERDADGWVIATTNPEGRRLVYERDPLGRVVAVRVDGDVIDLPSAEVLGRDLAGRLTIGPDGTLYRYDDAGRIAEIIDQAAGATTFTYTADGLVDTEVGPAGSRRFRYDTAGRVEAVDVDGVGLTTIEYDAAGRRARELTPDGAVTSYRWHAAGRLVAIEVSGSRSGLIEIAYDALGRPVLVGGDAIGYDPISGLADRVGADTYVTVGARRYDVLAREWLGAQSAIPLGGVPAGSVFVVGARVFDPATHQFLSADPLLAVAGSNGAASAYTYAWHDPVNYVDPSGLKPISIEEADAMRTREEQGRVGQFVEAIKNDPWGTLMMVGVVAVGVGLALFPATSAIGVGILVSTAVSGGIGFATGTFSPTGTAVSGAFGALPGGTGLRNAIAIGVASGAGETIATSLLTGEGFPPIGSIAISAGTGGVAVGASRAAHGLNAPNGTANLDHTPTPTTAASGAIYYRTMSESHFAELQSTGRIPATRETFISPTRAFSEAYDGTLVEVIVAPGTMDALVSAGVRDTSAATMAAHLDMPVVSSGWTSTSAFFKAEGNQINIGLGRGTALDIFNDGIQEFRGVPR